MTEPYDLRSNIKDKPGSQGTLFQVKDKGLLNPQQRWPRGYTPERRDEIAGALKDTVIKDRMSHPVMLSEPRVSDDGNHVRYAVYPEVEHRVIGTLARSTVPAEHLQGLEMIHDRPASGHLATYWPARKEMAVPMLGKRAAPGTGRSREDVGEESLLHELGHHVDNVHTRETDQHMQQGVAAKVEYAHGGREAVRYGLAEGVADNYYVEHYRGRGRRQERPTAGHYEENFDPQTLNKRYPGYTHVRPAKGFSNLSGAQFQGTLF